MSSGTASMMLPSALCSASAYNSLNTPEEDDETMSNKVDCEPGRPGACSGRPGACSGSPDPNDQPRPCTDRLPSVHPDSVAYGGHGVGGAGYLPYQPPHGLPAGYSQPTPFPSQEGEPSSSWLHPPSLASGWTCGGGGGGFPTSLPSYPSHKDPWPSYSPGDSPSSSRRFGSLPGCYSPAPGSLEQPHSLRSNPPTSTSANNVRHHTVSPYHCSPQGGACCAQCPADFFNRAPMMAAAAARPPGHHPHHTYGHYYADSHRLPGAGYGLSGHYGYSKQNNPAYNSPLSLEQRRVFVTYEADNDRHVNEIINFVALLRHNGFDTHIDMFEQHFRSISKIDFMERYLSEKEYLIIIIISPKYHETVTAPPVSLEGDERTLNTVYIHKQLQNEFIQNGSKNFRFIPILFPGARKSHVPNWLQNTHVYGWPRDRDDILRRLMRVEKYNPPPIGQLPTIIPIPI